MSKGGRTSVEDAELKILASLAEGPKSFYDLVRREKIASSNTVLKALDNLEKYLLVVKGEPEARNRIPYHLTVYGLVKAFSLSDAVFDIKKVVESYSDTFPLIFGKRELFMKEGIFKDILMRFIWVTTKNMEFIKIFIMDDIEVNQENFGEKTKDSTELDFNDFKKDMEGSKSEDDKVEMLTEVAQRFAYNISKETLFSLDWEESFIKRSIPHKDLYKVMKKSFETWLPYLKVYAKDQELKELFNSYIEEEIRKREEYLKALKDLKETWETLSN